MAIPINVRNAIDELKRQDPRKEIHDDETLYHYLKPNNPDLQWDDVDIGKKKANTSPNSMNAFEEWFDYGIDENSWGWMKAAYNQSLTGMTEELVKGKKRYNLEDYNPTILEDIGAMALSFWMPLDIIAMGTGGALGAGIHTAKGGTLFKGLSGYAMKGIEKRAGEEFGKKAMHHVLPAAIKQASTLATYEGAIGGVQAGINDEDVMSGIAKGVIHGGILGGLSGAAGGGLAFKHAEVLKGFEDAGKIVAKGEEATAMLTKGDIAKKWATGIPGQMVTEAGVFSNVELAERAMLHGEDIRLEDMLVTYGRNIGLFGLLKGQSALLNRGKKHMQMLKEYERERLAIQDDGSAQETRLLNNIIQERKEYIEQLRKEGKHSEADLQEKHMAEIVAQKTGLDQKHLEASERFKELEIRIDELQKNEEPSIKRANDIINTINELIGIEEVLIQNAEKSAGKVYAGSIAEFKATQNELIRLAERWGKKRKKAEVWSKEKIEQENIEMSEVTGEQYSIYDFSKDFGLNLNNKKDRAKAQDILQRYGSEKIQKQREKITPLTAEGEAIDIISTEDFRGKDWSGIATDKKMRKDIEDRVLGVRDPRTKKRAKGLADIDAEVAADTGNFVKGSTKSTKYENSKGIVRHFIQNILPTYLGGTVKEGAFVKDANSRARQMNKFAKFLAEQNKDFSNITNDDVKFYLSQNSTHVTQMQQLVQFIKDGRIASRKFNITPKEITNAAKKYKGINPEGVTTDAHVIGNNTISYIQPKTNQPISKYISKPLQDLFKKLKTAVGIKTPDSNQHFMTKDGKYLDNKALNAFTDLIFGKKKKDYENIGTKKIHSQARLFRRSIVGWAAEKFKSKSSPEVELLIQEVLGDKAAVNVINKAYVSKEAQQIAARKLIRQFIKEIKSGGKKSKGKDFYSTKEIADGLKKLDGKKDIRLKVDGKDVVIDGITAETMAKYLVETGPRLNEVVLSGQTKYQLESAASRLGTTVAELKKMANHFKELYPELDIQIKNNLGKHQGEYVLGRVTGHLIEIAKGRAKADTIPHEVSHHVVDVLRAFGDKRSKDLIRDGERMFRGEENMVQAIGEYVAGTMKNKTTFAKAKQWVQKFWSHIKNRLGIHNAEDVTRILGERVTKGKLPDARLKEATTKFQKEAALTNKDEATKTEWKNIQADIKGRKLEQVVPRNIRIRERKRLFGEENYKMDNSTVDQIERYRSFLEDYNLTQGKSARVIPFRIERINEKYHISPELSKETLKLMNVKDGLYENASPETAKAYESFIRNQYEKPLLKETTYDKILHEDMQKTFDGKFLSTAKRAVMPVWLVLGKYGGKPGKKIRDLLLEHEVVEHVEYKGKMDQALYLAKQRLNKDVKHIHLFDKERATRNYKEGNLTEAEKIFYENIYIKKNKDSSEYKAHDTWEDMSKWAWQSLGKELSRHQTPEGVKKIMAELDRKRVDGYMTRRLTKEAILNIGDKSTSIEKLVKNNQDNVAIKRAKAEAKSDSERILLEERYKKDKNLTEEIRTEVYDAIMFGYNNVKNPNLIERGVLLPEYIDITDVNKGTQKRIKVYDDSVDATAETYIRRMSKYLASVRLFPEWTGIGSKYKIDTSKRLQVEALEKNPNLGSYAIKSIKRQLGIDKSDQMALASPIYRGLGHFTNASAAMGLSSPLSGIKNLMIGIPRSIGGFGIINTARSIGRAFDSVAWHEARKKGYLEYGSKSLELGSVGWGNKLTMANMFKYWNLMTGTENFNRIVSSHAGQLYYTQALSALRGEGSMFKMGTNKKRMRNLMKELWRLNESDVNFLENTKDLTTKDAIARQAEILNKVGHFSHVSSQGGTSTVLLPLWMSSKEAKPLTLFQRMAMSTTIDSYRNFVKPIAEFGNIMPLARAAMAHSLSGAALYWMYDELFGKQKPIGSKMKQDDNFDKIMMNLWRSEFFGLFGEVLNPYEQGVIAPVSKPIVIRNGQEAFNQFTQAYLGGKTSGQAIKGWVRNTVVAGSQLETLYKTSKSKYYKDFKTIRAWTQSFKKAHNMSQYSAEGTISRRAPYYMKLKDALMFGTEQDIAQEYWKAFDFIVSDLEDQPGGTSVGYRIKQAKAQLKQVIKHYEPLNISDNPKGTSSSDKRAFLEWLSPENAELAIKMEKQFQYNLRNYLRIISNSKYKKDYSVYPYL